MLVENVLAWAVAGVLGGWFGRTVVKTPGRIVSDLFFGCIGGLLGGWIFSWYGHIAGMHIFIGSSVVAFLSAIVLLLIVRLFSVKKTA